MIEVLTVILPVFGLAAIGFAASRLDIVPAEGLAGLRFFLLYLALPAFIFQLVAATPLAGTNLLAFALTATFATYCAFAIAFSIAALINRGQVLEATVEGLVGSAAEVTYLGPAVALAAFGMPAAAPLALVLAVDSAMIAAMTPLMMALGGSGRSDPAAIVEGIVRKVFLNPLVLATIAGLLAAAVRLRLPGLIDAFFTLLRQAAPAVALFALGAGLPLRAIDPVRGEVPWLLGVKLIAHPLIVYLLLNWVGGFDRAWVQTAVLLAALPPSVSVLDFAKEHGIASDRIAGIIALATAVSMATVTIVLVLLFNNLLPVRAFR